MTRSSYIAPIQGLRAFAIACVVIFHANPKWLPGGYTGVDIFFVLSGFLITRLLTAENRQYGRIDLWGFYAKRLLRLAPALIAMIAFASPVAQLLIARPENTRQSMAAATAALWVSNFYFAMADVDYFSIYGSENAFLHTWSLSVEEQFYLFWPVALLTALNFTTRRGKSTKARSIEVSLFVLAWAGSILLLVAPSMVGTTHYLLSSRLWEFLLGATAYALTGENQGRYLWVRQAFVTSRFSVYAPYLGISCMLLGVTGATPIAMGTWGHIVSSAVGTGVLLASINCKSSGWPMRVLAAKPAIAVGDLSYSWYLWHWPCLVLMAIVTPSQKTTGAGSAVVISLAVAYLSYRFIENPFRRQAFLMARPRATISGVIFLSFAVCLANLAFFNHSYDKSLSQSALGPVALARHSMPDIYREHCDDWFRSSEPIECRYGNAESTKLILMFGDSTLGQWFSPLLSIYSNLELSVGVYTKSACPIADVPFHYPRIDREYVECDIWREAVIEKIIDSKPSVLFIGSSFGYPFDEGDWIQGTTKVLDRLSQHVGKIFLVASTPSFDSDPMNCLRNQYSQLSRLGFALTTSCLSIPHNKSGLALVNDALKKAAKLYGNVELVDFFGASCPDMTCHSRDSGPVVFRDQHHVTDDYARQAEVVIRDLVLPLN